MTTVCNSVESHTISCRPYSFESTRSHLNSEVNQRKGRLVLASETGWKYLTADYFLYFRVSFKFSFEFNY